MSSAIDQEKVRDLSSWDSARKKPQSITPKASEPPTADSKGKTRAEFREGVYLGK